MKRPEWKPLPDEPTRSERGETYNEWCARTGGRSYELARPVAPPASAEASKK